MIDFMDLYYLFLLGLSIAVAACIMDDNLAYYIHLRYRLLIIDIKMAWLRMWLHPQNPWTNFIMNRRLERLTKEIQKAMEEKND